MALGAALGAKDTLFLVALCRVTLLLLLYNCRLTAAQDVPILCQPVLKARLPFGSLLDGNVHCSDSQLLARWKVNNLLICVPLYLLLQQELNPTSNALN